MTLRLRTGPPRRHADIPLAAGVGLALLVAIALPLGALQLRGDDAGATGPVRIELLDGVAAETLLPHTPKPFLDRHRVVAYYGNPLAPQMGIVGEYEPEEVIRRLRAQAEVYQRLSPDRTVVPAIHMIYAVAQDRPGAEGNYLLRMDDDLVWKWVRLTREQGMLLFLDIQFGRSSIDHEFPHVAPFLKERHVHLALDPEFAMNEGEIPGEHIGQIDAADIRYAQEYLANLSAELGLPPKVLIVHQFHYTMIKNKDQVAPYPGVQLVIDMDGHGPPEMKLETYAVMNTEHPVEFNGVKLFYQFDVPVLSAAEVLALQPIPDVVIYQ